MELESQINPELMEKLKKDDFFDDDSPKPRVDSPAPEVNGDVHDADKDGGNDGENTQEPEVAPASGGESNDAEIASTNGEPAVEGGAVAGENTEEPADEGFQSTSPRAVSDVVTAEQDGDQVNGQQEDEESHKPEIKEEETEPSKPTTENDAEPEVATDTDEVPADSKQEEEAVELTTALDSDRNEVNAAEAEEEQAAEAKYDDDKFSVQSLASIDSTGKSMNKQIEVEDNQTEELEGDNKELDVLKTDGNEEDSKEPAVLITQGSVSSRSPTPSRTDSRAETADTVDPAPVLPDEPHKLDDRSSLSEVKETGEYRGEDRNDAAQPDGTEDSRGQGQWKSAEQQYIASAVLAQKSEQEALKEVEEERDKLVVEKTSLQIKDLQERLAVLAREGEEKDKKIQHLEDELRSTKRDLHQREDQLEEEKTKHAKALAAAASGGGDAPKSKTCVVM